MDKINQTFDFFKIPNPFRDVMFLIGGITTLLFSYIFLNINLFSKINLLNLGRLESDFILLVISFFIGRLIILVSTIFENIFNFTMSCLESFLYNTNLESRMKLFIVNWKSNWRKKLIEDITKENIHKTVSYDSVKDDITIIDEAKIIKDYPSIEHLKERSVYTLIFLRMIFSVILISSIVLNSYYLVALSIGFFVLILLEKEHLNNIDYSVYIGVVKYTKLNH